MSNLTYMIPFIITIKEYIVVSYTMFPKIYVFVDKAIKRG